MSSKNSVQKMEDLYNELGGNYRKEFNIWI